MTKKRGHAVNDEYLRQGSPTNSTYQETFPRYLASANNAAVTNGVMLSAAIVLQAGDLVTNITFRSGSTAVGTPTNWWFALYSNAATPALLAQTADQTSTAWAANTTMTKPLQTAQLITVSGLYYVSVMVAAASGPSTVGLAVQHANVSTGLLTTEKALAVTSGSSLTTTAPSTITSATAVTTVPYAVVT